MSPGGPKIVVSTSPGSSRVSLRIAVVAGLLASGLGFGGCVTSGEGEKLRHDITDLRTRLDQIDQRDKEYKEQVVKLRDVLDRATKLLTRNSADVGAKAAKAEQDIAALQGRIEELTHALELQNRQSADERNRFETRMAALEQTATKIVDKVAPTMPDDKEQLWAQAAQRLASGQRDDGRRFYRVFIQRFPADPRASVQKCSDRDVVRAGEQVPERGGRVSEGADRVPVSARGARGDVAAVAGLRAPALLHGRPLAAQRSGQALPEVAARH
jgi:hypothetical protein